MITATDARTWLSATEADEARLCVLIDEATAFLGRALNRYVGPIARQTEIKCGGPPLTDRLWLDQDPTDDPLPTVEIRSSFAYPWSELDESYWTIEGRELVHVTTWPTGRGTVRVSYLAGFAVGEGPAELRGLVRELVGLRWDGRGKDGRKASEKIGDYAYTQGDLDRLAGWQAIADSWRRRVV